MTPASRDPATSNFLSADLNLRCRVPPSSSSLQGVPASDVPRSLGVVIDQSSTDDSCRSSLNVPLAQPSEQESVYDSSPPTSQATQRSFLRSTLLSFPLGQMTPSASTPALSRWIERDSDGQFSSTVGGSSNPTSHHQDGHSAEETILVEDDRTAAEGVTAAELTLKDFECAEVIKERDGKTVKAPVVVKIRFSSLTSPR
ncbi:hypothetical protein JG687_00011440 [Phytophthora cactorum]|uniref:Uncharacterized protein n=1 Tax=Phytophthora cactorum TaxID=29920 RepID=A0A329RXQ4_9STRA|nr:hypothetical protein Pcac1_g424 [Phytophthora cactorum]KAG2822645.1 hypothetical protein PC111_g10551 [Phytophthora cactorum]KAG2849654.1 hypothetical protein PC112_g190 [Phytophthora cactorum]KAG2857472.1 hypothetical protein PC113_g10669 [Phytophthora cactorum]KAG2920423.1 hypothetical protein PC115_g9827 [Phytophthora cactorum]